MLLNPTNRMESVIETYFKKLVWSVSSSLAFRVSLIAKEGAASFLKINYMFFTIKAVFTEHPTSQNFQ